MESDDIRCTDLLGAFRDSVICGDNCDVMATMPKESIDLVVTSPPYDDLRTYGGHEWDFYGVAWNLKRVLKQGGTLVWIVADATKDGNESGSSMKQALHFRDLGMNLHDTMIYEKAGTGACGSNLAYWQTWEYAFVLTKGKPHAFNPLSNGKTVRGGYVGERLNADGSRKPVRMRPGGSDGRRSNIWRYAVGSASEEYGLGHPAPYPIKLARDHVASWSNPGEIVLDCFCGSGTTCKAAKELERHWVGIDCNAKYCEIAQRRLAQEVMCLTAPNGEVREPRHE